MQLARSSQCRATQARLHRRPGVRLCGPALRAPARSSPPRAQRPRALGSGRPQLCRMLNCIQPSEFRPQNNCKASVKARVERVPGANSNRTLHTITNGGAGGRARDREVYIFCLLVFKNAPPAALPPARAAPGVGFLSPLSPLSSLSLSLFGRLGFMFKTLARVLVAPRRKNTSQARLRSLPLLIKAFHYARLN